MRNAQHRLLVNVLPTSSSGVCCHKIVPTKSIADNDLQGACCPLVLSTCCMAPDLMSDHKLIFASTCTGSPCHVAMQAVELHHQDPLCTRVLLNVIQDTPNDTHASRLAAACQALPPKARAVCARGSTASSVPLPAIELEVRSSYDRVCICMTYRLILCDTCTWQHSSATSAWLATACY